MVKEVSIVSCYVLVPTSTLGSTEQSRSTPERDTRGQFPRGEWYGQRAGTSNSINAFSEKVQSPPLVISSLWFFWHMASCVRQAWRTELRRSWWGLFLIRFSSSCVGFKLLAYKLSGFYLLLCQPWALRTWSFLVLGSLSCRACETGSCSHDSR